MNILFINLEDRFGTCQRVLLKEMELFKEAAHGISLFCLNETYLHTNAKQIASSIVTIPQAKDLSYFRGKGRVLLKRQISEQNIEMVVLYGEVKLQTLNWLMGKFQHIPFVIFLFDSFHGVKQKQSLRRVDQFVTRSEFVSYELQARYKISNLKIKKIDTFPSDFYLPESIEHSRVKHDTVKVPEIKDGFLAGALVNDDINRITQLEDFLFALKSGDLRNRCKVLLFSAKKWTHRNIHSELRRTLKDSGLEDTVLPIDLPAQFSFESNTMKLKFWFAFNQNESVNDDYLFALQNKIPCIFPRRAGNLEVFEHFELSGTNYSPGNSGDIRRAIKVMLENHETYRKSLSASGKKILERFKPSEHIEIMEKVLLSVASRRKRMLKISDKEKSL